MTAHFIIMHYMLITLRQSDGFTVPTLDQSIGALGAHHTVRFLCYDG